MMLFFSLLPLYILGNIHCIGMCGPLVLLIGRHRFRYFYLLGRILSFSLAAFLAAGAGAVLHLFLKDFYLSEGLSFLFGTLIIFFGFSQLFGWKIFHFSFNTPFWKTLQMKIANLLLQDRKTSTFFFGFLTVALPCGQTLVVFSACALNGDPWVGLGNGFAFSLLTTPSLFLAMHASAFLKRWKGYDPLILGSCAILVGLLSVCRGCAEMGWISHWILNPDMNPYYHLVVF